MTFLYRIIVTISALLVIVIGGSWLGHRYNIGPDLGWWTPITFPAYFQANLEDDGIPATESGVVSIPISSGFGQNSWARDDNETRVLPVIYGDRGFFTFNAYASGSNRSQQSGGACHENVVNILVISDTNPEGAPVFQNRVLLPRYFYFFGDDGQSVAALVVSRDTNGDSKLDCGDEAHFEIHSLNDGAVRRADRVFRPDSISQMLYSDRTETFTLSEVVYEGDEVAALKNIKISWKDLAISESIAPDLISKANAAFANTLKD